MVKQPAGFWIRFGASILDGLLLGLVTFIISMALNFNEDGQLIFDSVVQLAYLLILPVLWYGYTLGKKVCGIRIVRMDGSNVGFGTMLLRVLVAGFVYVITLGIAYVVSAFMVGLRKDKRSIHDMIANTYVTYEKPVENENPYQTKA
ncbi:RDD family protein [Alkalihalophilus pseudofirmus]|uniref:RDD family protein n=1 Tax=Alkalihalophilus pseudofirmus TaxID=79885 RepID=UPI00259B4A85|nr:RDD family protein [Alkalihalophilus pseudofirmus]WEG16396.1 RDD family protein [Alkalihalophilus pseudofirmus]